MSGNKGSLKLRIRKAGATIREGNFDQETLILGSGADAAVRLEDPSVSNLHVMLKVEKNGVTAIDLGSENGTRVGNSLIRQPVTLNPGDVIQLGNYEVEVFFGDGRSDPPVVDFSSGLEQPPAASVLAAALRSRTTFQAPVAAAAAVAKAIAPRLKKVTPLRPAPRIVPTPRARGEASAWKLLRGPLPHDAVPTANDHALQVSQLWGDRVLAVEHFGEGVDVRVGEGKHNVFSVYAPSIGSSYVLATSRKGTLFLNLPDGAEFAIFSAAGARITAQSLTASGRLRATGRGTQLELSLDERAHVQFDAMSFFLRHVKPPAAVNIHKLEKYEGTYFGIALAVLLLAAAVMTVLALRPVREMTFEEEAQRAKREYISFLMKKREAKARAAPRPLERLSGVKEGPKAKNEEGKMGKQQAKPEEAAPSRKGSPAANGQQREVDRTKVMHSGLLGAFASNPGPDLLGPGGLGTGINKALGGLKGEAALGDAHGIGGMGTRGTGTGAGGTGLGIGGLGTKGMGHGAGGYGTVDLGGKGHEITRIIPGRTTVVGGLSREVIERVIKQHQSEIKYCYEIELNQRPELAGKVAVAFTIDGGGAVSDASVSETTLRDTNTEQCMLSKIRRWRFPQPIGGGTVSVNFPWIFKPAG